MVSKDLDVVKLINSLKLGIPCDFGFKKTKHDGIWVELSRGHRLSKHTTENNIQITVKVSKPRDSYIVAKDVVNRIVEALQEESACYGIETSYAGELDGASYYYITCKIF